MDDKLYERLLYDPTPATYYEFWNAVALYLESMRHLNNDTVNVLGGAIRHGLETLPCRTK